MQSFVVDCKISHFIGETNKFLFMEVMMNKVYITPPVYYVNGEPHIGHAHTSVMCDSLKRANIMNGNSMFYTTGVDEHGQKNQKYIEDSGLSQEEYLDKASCNMFRRYSFNI